MRERSRESRHQKWLADQAYSQFFASPTIIWAKWIDNQPHRCRCGCDGVWYGARNNANMLAYLFPVALFNLLWSERALFHPFKALHSFLQAILLVVLRSFLGEWARQYLPLWSSMFWEPILRHMRSRNWPRAVGRCVLLLVGAMAFAFWVSLWSTLFVLTWALRVLAVPVVLALYIVSLALVACLFTLVSILAAIYVVARGLAFVVAGVASVIYSYLPEVGVVLIVAGLLIEYAYRHSDEKRRRRELGRLIMARQETATATQPTDTD